MHDHVEVVRLLSVLGTDLSDVDTYGATPVFVASQQGQVEVVRLLAELGADASGFDEYAERGGEGDQALAAVAALFERFDIEPYSDFHPNDQTL